MNVISTVTASLIVSALLCIPVHSFAGDITVTAVTLSAERRGGSTAALTINGKLVIAGIGVSPGKEAPVISMPRHVSRRGRVFPQVRLLTREAQAAVRDAILGGKPAPDNGAPLRYRVERCRTFKKTSKLKGAAYIVFNDALEVEVTIAEGRNGCWVLWPQGRKRSRTAAVTDKRLRESIEQDILERFSQMRAEGVADGEGR